MDEWFEQVEANRAKDSPSDKEDESMVENELIDRSNLPK